MSTGLLFECDVNVANWIYLKHGWKSYKYDRAVGILDSKGMLEGAALFHNWNGFNVELSYYGEGTLTLGVIRCLAKFAALTFDPSRVTIITSKRNKGLMRSVQKLGFRLEGSQRCHFGKRDCNRNTGVRFVMFRETLDKIAKLPQKTAKCS